MNKKLAIIGGGNGGQAFSAYFKAKGYQVALYDAFQETVNTINNRGRIRLFGALEMEVPFAEASSNMAEVVDGAAIIIIINPSTYHRAIAAKLAGHLKKDQLIFINPGATFGAFAFKKALMDNGFTEDVTIAESNVLLFACRLNENGDVFIGAKKDRILVSAFPACRRSVVEAALKDAIPEAQFVKNVLATGIDNTNPLVHPAPTILNASWVESGQRFRFMHEAIGPTVGALMEKMDQERIALGKALGLTLGEDLFDLYMQYELEYGVKDKDNLVDVFRACDAYKNIYGPADLQTARYIVEDVAMGLTPLVSLGLQLGVKVEKMKLVVDICEGVLDRNFTSGDTCRNVKNLGLEGLNAAQVVTYAETGIVK